MRVTLAYPYQGHAADDVVEVDNRTGRVLLREGRARVAPPEPVIPPAPPAPEPPPKPTYKPRTVYHSTPDEPAETEE